MAANNNSWLPAALPANPALRTNRLVPARVITNFICQVMVVLDGTAAAGVPVYTPLVAPPATANGAVMANGTTLAQQTAFWTAFIQYLATTGASTMIANQDDIFFSGPFRGAGAVRQDVTISFMLDAASDIATNATAYPDRRDIAPNYTFRKLARWFTRETYTYLSANGAINNTHLKNGIPSAYKGIGFDFLEARLLASPLDNNHMMAHNCYYLLATERGSGQEDATNSANFTQGQRRTQGARRYHVAR